MTAERVRMIRDQLEAALAPSELAIEDESHLHAGHPGARDGRGHFRVSIRAEAFDGLSRLERQRRVFAALGDLMKTDIHALSISAKGTRDP